VDAAHEDLSGPAVRHILQREWEVYGKSEYERLAGISASHVYNLRCSSAYRKVRVRVEHTQARQQYEVLTTPEIIAVTVDASAFYDNPDSLLIVRLQLCKAGSRLAAILNALYDHP
jgi:hypothetical protein